MLCLSDLSYDLSSFLDVPEPRAREKLPCLSLSKDDRLSQNRALRQALCGVSTFRLRLSPDGRALTLAPEEGGNLTFTAAGVRTHHPLGELLRKKGLELPATFRMEWLEERRCWVGQYEGLAAPPPLAERPQPERRRKRRTS